MNATQRKRIVKSVAALSPKANFAIRWANLARYIGGGPCMLTPGDVKLMEAGIRQLEKALCREALSTNCPKCHNRVIGEIVKHTGVHFTSVIWRCGCGAWEKSMSLDEFLPPNPDFEVKP
jgi:hypothetical protein